MLLFSLPSFCLSAGFGVGNLVWNSLPFPVRPLTTLNDIFYISVIAYPHLMAKISLNFLLLLFLSLHILVPHHPWWLPAQTVFLFGDFSIKGMNMQWEPGAATIIQLLRDWNLSIYTLYPVFSLKPPFSGAKCQIKMWIFICCMFTVRKEKLGTWRLLLECKDCDFC